MGREVKRVPVDFSHPLKEIWPGYLMPDTFDEDKCPDCQSGYAPRAQHLHDLWYGYVPFDPTSTGSTPLRYDTPAVRAFAERNLAGAPDYYGSDEAALRREGQRLADLWNGSWGHHLSQDDVDALIAGGQLMDFTHTWSRQTGWQPKDPPYAPTAAEVNEWSIRGFGHDGINASIAVRARPREIGARRELGAPRRDRLRPACRDPLGCAGTASRPWRSGSGGAAGCGDRPWARGRKPKPTRMSDATDSI